MRGLLLALLAVPLPAAAWEAGVDGPLCTLTHQGAAAEVVLTYNPAGPLYSITLTRPVPWAAGTVFSLRFEGAAPNRISTDRQVLSADGTALTVTDRGFGNVLDGLAFNDAATALIGTDRVAISLQGAEPEVAAFRACIAAPSV